MDYFCSTVVSLALLSQHETPSNRVSSACISSYIFLCCQGNAMNQAPYNKLFEVLYRSLKGSTALNGQVVKLF